MTRAKSFGTLSLRHRLYLLTLVALAPALFLLGYNETVQRAERMREAQRSALRIGEQSSLELERVMAGATAVLLTLARAPSVRGFDADMCVPFLRDIRLSLPQFTSIAAADKTGQVRCRDVLPFAQVNVIDRPYFQEVLKKNDFVVGTYQLGRITGLRQLPLAYPVRDNSNAVSGAVIATLDLDWLNKLVNDRPFGPDEALTVADREGVILARHPFAERFIGTRIPDAFLPLVNAAQPGTQEVESQDGTRRIIGYFPTTSAPEGLYVSAGVGTEASMQSVKAATSRAIAAILAGAAIALVLANIIGNRLIREPLGHILRTLQAWQSGDTSARTGMAPVNEISAVGSAIDQFMGELDRAGEERRNAETKRELLNNELTHRVKNSLATVRAIANQTFQGTEMKPPLAVFSQRLVALGNAYDLLRAGEWHSADLRETVETTLQPYPKDRFEIAGPAVTLSSRATLSFIMALHELATNAAKYGALGQQGGLVGITWQLDGETFQLDWRERDGPPVHPPERTGFGSRMIQQILANDIDATVVLDYDPEGVQCRITAERKNVALN